MCALISGEVGDEMYIVNQGKLCVLSEQPDGQPKVLGICRAGSFVGEISLLNLGTEGNRRTASVASIGYSDLFCLSRKDTDEVLKDYPGSRLYLEEVAKRRLRTLS